MPNETCFLIMIDPCNSFERVPGNIKSFSLIKTKFKVALCLEWRRCNIIILVAIEKNQTH